jgi:hypothetical protein
MPPAGVEVQTAMPAAPVEAQRALPPENARRLRGVAAWSGSILKLTVYNPTNWRVSEIDVRVSRLRGETLVEDARPLTLVSIGSGLGTLETGVFEGEAGAQPKSFRWEIESARGFAPR